MKHLQTGLYLVLFLSFGCRTSTDKPLILAEYNGGFVSAADLSLDGSALNNQKLTRSAIEQKITFAFLKKVLVSEEELLFLQTNAAFQKNRQNQTQTMLSNMYLQRVMPEFKLTAEDLQQALVTQQASQQPEKRVLQNIFLRFPPDSDEAAKNAVRARATQIRAQITDAKSFAAMAKKHSQSSTASHGGHFGAITKQDLREPLASAVFSLKKNQISDVIENTSGCHLFFLKEIQTPAATTTQGIRQQQLQAMRRDWADVHLTECLINLGKSIPNWPDVPADQTGVLFSLGDQAITQTDINPPTRDRDSLRQAFLNQLRRLVFSHQMNASFPEDAAQAEAILLTDLAFRSIRQETLVATIKAMPAEKLQQHFQAYPEHFQTQELMTWGWYSWSFDPATRANTMENAQAFTGELQQQQSPTTKPEGARKVGPFNRKQLAARFPKFSAHLPETLKVGDILGPLQLGNLIVVTQLTNYQPQTLIPRQNLGERLVMDYLKTHLTELSMAENKRLIQEWQFQINQENLMKYWQRLQPSQPES